MNVQLKTKPKTSSRNLILAVHEGVDPQTRPWFRSLPVSVQQTVRAFTRTKEFVGKAQEVHVIPFGSPAKRVVLLGLGQAADWNQRRLILASRQIVAIAKQHRLSEIALDVHDVALPKVGIETLVERIVENAHMADYAFTMYRKAPAGGWPALRTLTLHVRAADRTAAGRGVRAGTVVGRATNAARDLANTPGGDMTPALLAKAAAAAGQRYGFSVQVLEKAALEKLGMGGVLGVARGSHHPPTFTVCEYVGTGQAKAKPIVFVGKGVTFDSGGLNVKPDTSMYEMHMDMSGAAAVIGALSAIAQLKLPVRVIGLLPAAENMSAGDAYRPGDQLRTLSGKTIEVLHTDAEGRVILADALTYAERFKPATVIDVATLTGAAMVALGQRASAILSPDERFSHELHDLAEASGDLAWPLPLWREYEEDIQGTFGDVANSSKVRYGGAITGAAFLWQFAKKFKRWAHVDIAPTMTTIEGQFLAKGSSGAGVRLLVAYARHHA